MQIHQNLFIPSTVDGHLGSSKFGDISNSAAMEITSKVLFGNIYSNIHSRTGSRDSNRYLCINIHLSIIDKSQKVESNPKVHQLMSR